MENLIKSQKALNRETARKLLFVIFGAVLLWNVGTRLSLIVRANDIAQENNGLVPSAMKAMESEFINVKLPLEMNKEVEYWMHHFSTLKREAFLEQLSRAGLYSEMIRTKLIEYQMPEELLYLAQIESGYMTRARSVSSASGVWQFMGPTARQYGLRIDGYVDERRDPVRATDAAVNYLRELYERYESWYLAAAAYNAGPTRVSRLLRQHTDGRVGDENLYWEIIDHLPKETAQYVPKLLAVTYLAKYGQISGVSESTPYVYDDVWTPGGIILSDLAQRLGMPSSLIEDLNPHLIRGITPPGEIYLLRVPVGSSTKVVSVVGFPERIVHLADD
jgi:membrane-bound lytic murein transglycosylase D